MFDYQEIEKLTKLALPDPGECFSYLTPACLAGTDLDLTLLNSKSFRIINRLKEYMMTNNMTLYSQVFPNGMIKVSKIK
jgi:hypothetical protein